ncbi:MAG: integrin alpha [Pseudomonadota bacterium]
MRILQVIALGLIAGCRGCGESKLDDTGGTVDTGEHHPHDSRSEDTETKPGDSCAEPDDTGWHWRDSGDTGWSRPCDDGEVETPETITEAVASFPEATISRVVGDIDGDGFLDIAAGYECVDGMREQLAIYRGPLQGTYTPTDGDFRMYFDYDFCWEVWWDGGIGAVEPVADQNGDGLSELLVDVWGYAGSHHGESNWDILRIFYSPLGSAGAFGGADGGVYLHRNFSSVSAAGDPTGDGVGDVVLGFWDSEYDSVWTGAAVLPGPLVSGSLDDASLIGGCATYEVYSVDASMDFDGDGIDDLLIGGEWERIHGGIITAFLGPVEGNRAVADADLFLGTGGGLYGGATATWLPDPSGDGRPDILVGAHYEDLGCHETGTVWAFRSPAGEGLQMRDADMTIHGRYRYDGFGSNLADAGDVDADGVEDILLGAGGEDGTERDAGAVYLVLGAPSGVCTLEEVATRYASTEREVWYLGGAGTLGDTYGPAGDEFLASARGAAYVFTAP